MEPINKLDEVTLIRKMKEGSNTAFIQLYNQYHHQLYIYILKFVKVPEYAEDVLQDVFLKIWEIRDKINPELSFNAYLYKISRNKVFKLLKKMVSDESMRTQVFQQLNLNAEGPHVKLLWKQYNDILQKAIEQLPPQRKKVFQLCREQGKTYEEAATELGISKNTIKEHMIAAMKFIKEQVFLHGDLTLFVLYFISQKNK